MAASMRRFAPLLLALPAACGQVRPVDPADTAVAHAAGPKSTEMAKMVQDKNLGAKQTNNPVTQGQVEEAASSAAPAGGAASVAVDANRKREYADVYVNLKDPSGQKGLAYYLMKPEEWTIEKVTQVSPTVKHWRFWRIVRTDGKALPEVDPLKPKEATSTPFKHPKK